MMKFEIKEDGKFSFTVLKMPSFCSWLGKKGLSEELKNQPIRKKREIFLTWKWGYNDSESLEATEKQGYYSLLQISQQNISGLKNEYNRNKIGWYNYTISLWEVIERSGLLTEEIENGLWENRFKEDYFLQSRRVLR